MQDYTPRGRRVSMDRSLHPEVDTTARQDPQHVEALIEAYAPSSNTSPTGSPAAWPASIDVDDLISAGVVGLLDAIQKYDPQRPNTFKTYAECRIRGAMLDSVRAGDWVPRSVRDKAHALTKAYAAIAYQQGRPATDEDVAAWLGLDLDTLDKWLTQVRGVSVVSLEQPLAPAAQGEACTVLAQLADAAPNPAQLTEAQELQEHLAAAIDTLPAQEKIVLSLYYHEELTMQEIGAVLGVTESRVSQIRTKAMFHLRAALQHLTHDAYAPVG